MPSMHFGYSFCIGCTMLYHSGIFRKSLEPGETRKSKPWQLFYVVLAIAYPSWIVITIVATANHYYLDACVAFFVAIIAFLCNQVFLIFLPLEDLLLWCLRLEKPIPTTGDRFRKRAVRAWFCSENCIGYWRLCSVGALCIGYHSMVMCACIREWRSELKRNIYFLDELE